MLSFFRTAAKYGAYNVRVFGSVARGEADEQSDIDLLVNMKPGRSLFDLGGLLTDLADSDIVWKVVFEDLPTLEATINAILNTEDTTQ